jgi:hypothetical protein
MRPEKGSIMRKSPVAFVSILAFSLIGGSAFVGRVGQKTPMFVGISDRDPAGAPGISRDGLVAAYDMSTFNVNGTLRDFSGKGHHGRAFATTSVPGLWGRAMMFQSATDRVDLPETPAFAIDGPLSVLIWFRLDTLGLHQHLVACDDKFAVWLTNTNRLRFVDTVGDGAMTKEPLTSGRWYSVAGVFNGTKGAPLANENTRVYIDGKLVAVDLVGQPRNQPTWNPGRLFDQDACYIGFESHQGLADHQTLRFAGVIDELLVFNRPLAQAEVEIHASREQ